MDMSSQGDISLNPGDESHTSAAGNERYHDLRSWRELGSLDVVRCGRRRHSRVDARTRTGAERHAGIQDRIYWKTRGARGAESVVARGARREMAMEVNVRCPRMTDPATRLIPCVLMYRLRGMGLALQALGLGASRKLSRPTSAEVSRIPALAP